MNINIKVYATNMERREIVRALKRGFSENNEKYIEAYCKHYRIDFVIPRLANVYGPRQWQGGFIPSTIGKLLKKESPIIYGTGHQTRDFLYVDDAIEALIMLSEKGKREVYNVGSGKEVSLQKMFSIIRQSLGSAIKEIHENQRVQETHRSALDITKIKKEFGWTPRVDMKAGILKTITSLQRNERN